MISEYLPSEGSSTTSPRPSTRVTDSRLSIMEPYPNERLPDALVATIPPTLQYGPTEGLGPRMRPYPDNSLVTAPRRAPGPANTTPSRYCIWSMREVSRMTPPPSAPPTSPVPAPRAVTGVRLCAAHRTIPATSPTFRGSATPRGLTLYPLASTE